MRILSGIKVIKIKKMKLIGKGYCYNVYELNNSRVLKLEKGFFQKVCDIYQFEGKKVFDWLRASFKLLTGRKKILASYSYMRSNVDLALLGSPKFLEGINYEQDKVELLEAIIIHSNFIEKKGLIDLYIQNIIQCWKNGFADRVYNFTINNGIDYSGRLILLDFNEVTFLKEEALKRIKSKRWLRASSFKHVDSELQKYYQEQMDLLITPESLEKNWVQGELRF
ncbi:MAG: hypothetical protein V1845_00810 [bacterium]